MREIKFRAWESLTSTLWQPHEIEVKFINDSHNVTVPRGDGYVTYHQFENSPHPLILMQYTGLKDKDGKEIFEGDIVTAWSQGYQATGEVKQRIDGLWLMYPAYQHGKQWGLCPNPKGATTVEIIGNIHDTGTDGGTR